MKHNISFSAPGAAWGKHLVWVTDMHLDAASHAYYERFLDLISAHHPDFLLIGGDISNGKGAFLHLEKLAHFFNIPLLFVLGNHDYYYSSIAKTRRLAGDLCNKYSNLHYLTSSEIIPLSENTAIIGHDGWSDGRAGDFLNSTVMLNDYLLIDELSGLSTEERLSVLNELGNEAASSIKQKLEKAFEKYDHVILLTHTPPFIEACYYGEHPSDANWSPHFVCLTLGEVLKESAAAHPDKQLLVLCGHTHTGIDVHIAPNLRVLTGESVLGAPTIQGIVYI